MQPFSINIAGLYFAQAAKRFAKIDIATIIPPRETTDNPRFPAVEHILGTAAVTRECSVVVLDRLRRRRKFVIFFKHEKDGSVNGALKEMSGLIWKGEMIVMKHGDRCFVTGINNKTDQILAIEAVYRLVAGWLVLVGCHCVLTPFSVLLMQHATTWSHARDAGLIQCFPLKLMDKAGPSSCTLKWSVIMKLL